MSKNIQEYYQAIKYLENLPSRKKIDYEKVKTGRNYFLKRFAYLMSLLGNPQDTLQYFHVAGTSGKGSISTMLQNVFTEAGYQVGLFISPHCTTTTERISINGTLISTDDFVRLVNYLKPYVAKAAKESPYGRPSYSEILNAVAFLYFQEKNCDFVVLEVGMGGKYDSTNIIKNSKAIIINNIGLDHTQVLGKTIKKISQEKAGVIKKQGLVFTPKTQAPEALEVIKKVCDKKDAKLHIINPPKINYQLKLLGKQQQQNATIVTAVAKLYKVKPDAITTGLGNAFLPCRFEIVQKNPTIILDGAHNFDKMKSTVEALSHLTHKKLYLIIALTSNRDAKEIFKSIVSAATEVIVTEVHSKEKKFHSAKQLARKLSTNKKVKIIINPVTALTYARKKAGRNDAILITGSFYLAGLLRQKWQSEKTILINQKISWQKI